MSSLVRRGLFLFFSGLCAIATTTQGQTVTYQSPDFDFAAFDADAVSLSQEDRGQVVDALAALSRNFSTNGEVDSDLREKAIAIALRLDPLNGPARQTHEALLTETLPTPLEYLTSRSKVGTILLSNAAKLQENRANVDDQALALYLWELGLATHPAPKYSQVVSYQTALVRADKRNVPWKEFVTISPGSPSEIAMRRTVSRLLNEGEPPAEGESRPGPPVINAASIFSESPPTTMEPTEPKPQTSATLVRETATVPFITDVRGTPVAGNLTLTVRTPDETEASLLGLFSGTAETGEFETRLRLDRESSFQLTGIRNAAKLVRETYPIWPNDQLVLASFTPLEQSAVDSGEFNAFLPTAIGLRSLFDEALPLRSDLAVVGNAVSQQSNELVVDPDTFLSLLEASKGKGYQALLIPEIAESLLEESTMQSDNPMELLRPQLLSMSGLAAYESHLVAGGMPEPTTIAMTEFIEVEDLLDKGLTLRQIATNEIVQGRLTGILEKCPNHLSAKLLLAWGKADLFVAPTTMPLSESLEAVDQILAPFVKQLRDARDGSGVYYPNIDDDLGEAFSDLRRLSSQIDPQAKEYLRLAEDSLDPFELFLSVRDKTTSSALQKRAALSNVLADLKDARDRLGEN